MFRTAVAASALVIAAMGFSQVAAAEEQASDTATIVVYRADENLKTGRLSLDVHVGEDSLGRLKSDDAVVISRPAGQYTLGTSMKGTEPLVIDLKPGSTHYIYTGMKMQGTRVLVEMSEVEEQVARVQQPSIDSAI